MFPKQLFLIDIKKLEYILYILFYCFKVLLNENEENK